jgi:hypothetical protein
MNESVVSPDRCETNWAYPPRLQTAMASSVSVTVPSSPAVWAFATGRLEAPDVE